MKFLRYAMAGLLIFFLQQAHAQNFKADLKKLNTQVEQAYKTKKVTENEYNKLKQEHDLIQLSIDKAAADGITTPDEKNKIYSKILRAKRRLAKYKTNREIY